MRQNVNGIMNVIKILYFMMIFFEIKNKFKNIRLSFFFAACYFLIYYNYNFICEFFVQNTQENNLKHQIIMTIYTKYYVMVAKCSEMR